MEYIIKFTMSGDFPGSPDHDYFKVNEYYFLGILSKLRKAGFKQCDTLEDAQKSKREVEI